MICGTIMQLFTGLACRSCYTYCTSHLCIVVHPSILIRSIDLTRLQLCHILIKATSLSASLVPSSRVEIISSYRRDKKRKGEKTKEKEKTAPPAFRKKLPSVDIHGLSLYSLLACMMVKVVVAAAAVVVGWCLHGVARKCTQLKSFGLRPLAVTACATRKFPLSDSVNLYHWWFSI